MKLYVFPFAPNAAKVRLYVAEKRLGGCEIAVDEVMVNLVEKAHLEPDYLAVNPLGTVPALETDTGTIIHESLPIIEYFEELHPDPPMMGDDADSRALARQLERIVDIGMLMAIARELHATQSPLGHPANADVAAYHRARWKNTAAYLETQLRDGRRFLGGDRVSVADCTLQAILQFARMMRLDALADYPRLAAWDEAHREREPVKATIPL